MLLWVLWVTPVSESNPRSRWWESPVYSPSARSTGGNRTCHWHLKWGRGVGAVLSGWAPNLWTLIYLQVDSVRTELNYRTFSWCQRIVCCGETVPLPSRTWGGAELLHEHFESTYCLQWVSQVVQWQRIHLPLQETQAPSLDQQDPRRRKWQPAPAFLPGKSHGRRNRVGYSPRACKESDTT